MRTENGHKFMEKPGIEPATSGFQGIGFIFAVHRSG